MLFSATLVSIASVLTAALSEPAFSRAALTTDGLCFESPLETDWEVLARQRFPASTIANPPRDQIRWIYHTGFLTFATTLPDSLQQTFFYILSETGVRTAPTPHLKVSVVYDAFSEQFESPTLRGFYGELCFAPPPDLQDAGFVVSSVQPLAFHTTPATLLRSGSTTSIGLSGGTMRLPPSTSDAVALEVKTAYVLSRSDSPVRYLFVRRAPICPTACCEFAYDLYRLEPDLPVVATSAYGCDV